VHASLDRQNSAQDTNRGKKTDQHLLNRNWDFAGAVENAL
jgi:hypothetical protein